LNDASQVIGIMVLTMLFALLLDCFLFGVIKQLIRVRLGFGKLE
jgi:hypothetical protein